MVGLLQRLEEALSIHSINKVYIFALFVYINLWNFIDRGIIPGSSVEFNSFIKSTTHTSSPDALLGFLQSAFIVGFVLGSIIFSSVIHRIGTLMVVRIGMTVWLVAVVLCGLARFMDSYYFLLFCRMLSGVGEASIQLTMPPWVQGNAPHAQRGIWLSIYYTGLPVGTALGYTYSSFLANSIGWEFAYFFEAVCVGPAYLLLFLIPVNKVNSAKQLQQLQSVRLQESSTSRPEEQANYNGSTDQLSDVQTIAPPPTLLEEISVITKSFLYDLLILGNAAQTAVIIGLSTFGSAFFMSLGFYDTESEASTMFGVLISLAGIFGVPAGGWYIDYLSKRQGLLTPDEHGKESSVQDSSVESSTKLPSRDPGRQESLVELAIEEELDDQDRLINSQDETKKLAVQSIVLGQLTWASVVAAFVFIILYIVLSKSLYLFLIIFGCFMLFFTYTGIYMSVMMVVPVENRPFAVAFCGIVSHVFGDVPSPIIVGFIKDTLAPDCVSHGDDDDNIAASSACRGDKYGLRMTFLVITLWLLWTVFFFGWAFWHNQQLRSRQKDAQTQSILKNAE